MSAREVNRLFEAIEGQYEVDGTIDHHQKQMLLLEMKKFKGGDKFVQRIDEAFRKLENVDDAIVNQSSETSEPKAKGTMVTSRRNKLNFNAALKVFNLFKFSCNVEFEQDN